MALNKVVMETTFPELELFVSTILFETVGSDVSQHLVRASRINFTLGGINFFGKISGHAIA